MGFTDLFKFGSKKNNAVKVDKVKKESINLDGMASSSPSAAAGALAKMMDQQNAPTKVLMVQDGEYMQQVTDYAMKMAQRLDCDIIALDVTNKPLQFSGDRKKRETDRFMQLAEKNAEQFIAMAQGQGIKVEHIMDIGNPEEVIARVSADDAGVRYVLSKPEGEAARADGKRAHVPVFDLRCSRL